MNNPILDRIRTALVKPAEPAPRPMPPDLDNAIRAVLPATGKNEDENLALFAKNATGLRADFRKVANVAEAVAVIKQLAQEEKWDRIATYKATLTDEILKGVGLPVYSTNEQFDKNELEKIPVSVTECDALVAHTGSVLVTSKSTGGRAITILPPHHIVIARRNQIVPGLPDAFALVKKKYGNSLPSMISFITGPSRTGDIERILVLGAHGPKKLTIICLD